MLIKETNVRNQAQHCRTSTHTHRRQITPPTHMAQDMSGKEPPLPCNTSARIRNLSEEDAWRARQVLASSKKRLQRSSSNGGLAEGSSPPAGLSVCSRPLSAGNDIGIGVVTETFRGAAACHSKVGDHAKTLRLSIITTSIHRAEF